MASASNSKLHLIRIHDQINNATHRNDLEKLLKYVRIPLNTLKYVLNYEMQQLDQHEIKKVCFNCCYLDTIIPGDIIQSILSFIPNSSSVPNVNKKFKKLSEKNKSKQMKLERSLFESLVQKEFKLNDLNHIHVVILYQNEICISELIINHQNISSYHKYTNLKQCIDDNNKNNTVVFVYDGEYKLSSSINQKIAFIGKTDNVTFKLEADHEYLQNTSNVYFENISFSLTNTVISIESNSNLWMKQCKFKTLTSDDWGTISMERGTNHSLYLNECEFVGMIMNEHPAICLCLDGVLGNVNIVGCRFTNFGSSDEDDIKFNIPYICIQHGADINHRNLKIVGNTFDLTANNRVQPIAYNTWHYGHTDKYDEFVKSKCYTINDNVVIGDILQLNNPNKIYDFIY